MAGLPGTGLGGLFYVLLILWMIVRKAMRPGIYARWHQLLPLGGMAAAIITILWAEMWAIGKVVGRLPTIAELEGIYDPGVSMKTAFDYGDVNVHVKGNLKLTGWYWSSAQGDAPGKPWQVHGAHTQLTE